jgi:membrane protein YdbS with pleckstrin-like domain
MYYLGKLLMRLLFWCIGQPALFLFEFMGMKKETAAEAAVAVTALFLVSTVIIIPAAQWRIFRGLRAANDALDSSSGRRRPGWVVRYALLLVVSVLALILTFSAFMLGFGVPIWPIVPLFLLSGAAGVGAAVGQLVERRWRWPVGVATVLAVISLMWYAA